MVTGGRNEAVRVCEVIGGPEEISRAVALIQEIVAAIDKPRPSRPTPPSHTQEGVSNIRDLELVISSDFIPVFVSSVDGHGGVWVQPIGLEDPVQLEGLVDEMTRYYGNTEDVYPGDVHVGDLFAASFDHDDKWYRVRVTCVSSGGVEVVYLDYGDYAAVNVRSLRPLRCVWCGVGGVCVWCGLESWCGRCVCGVGCSHGVCVCVVWAGAMVCGWCSLSLHGFLLTCLTSYTIV